MAFLKAGEGTVPPANGPVRAGHELTRNTHEAPGPSIQDGGQGGETD